MLGVNKLRLLLYATRMVCNSSFFIYPRITVLPHLLPQRAIIEITNEIAVVIPNTIQPTIILLLASLIFCHIFLRKHLLNVA
jgi:hypothetical protein